MSIFVKIFRPAIWADPERGGGGGGGGGRWWTGGPDPPSPEKSQKYRVSNIDLDPLKITKLYQASIQWWAIIGTPAKCHFNGVSLAGQ